MRLIVDIQKQLPSGSLEIAFDLEQDVLGILGSSGSGKSMTLRCIAGVETPTRGTIRLNNRVLFDSRQGINVPSRDRNVGYLFQNYALFPHLTVAQNIAYGLRNLTKHEIHRRVSEQLTQIRLMGLENRYPHQLSGGQQQRVALARAIAPEPDLLLLDEPFSALDTYLRDELEQQLTQTLCHYRGLTLFVSHNLEEVYRICQKLLILSAGKAIALAPKQEIFDRPKTLEIAKITGCKNYSKIKFINHQIVHAIDWGNILHVINSESAQKSKNQTHIGIHGHQITFPKNQSQPNTFPTWLTYKSELPHHVRLYLKLSQPPADVDDYHLQVDLLKEQWEQQQNHSIPWFVCLDPEKLLLLSA